MAERVFSDSDKAEIIRQFNADDQIVIGGKTFSIRPLNAKGIEAVFSLLKQIGSNLNASFKRAADAPAKFQVAAGITEAIVSIADDFDAIVGIVHTTLKRSTPSLERAFIEEEADFIEMTEQFWPIFARQNKLDVLLKKAASLFKMEARLENLSRLILQSSSSPTLSAGTTDGQPTSSLDEAPTDTETTSSPSPSS